MFQSETKSGKMQGSSFLSQPVDPLDLTDLTIEHQLILVCFQYKIKRKSFFDTVFHSFQRMDLNGDGVVSLDEFLETCLGDEHITRSIVAFSNVIV